jgi:putative transposase
MKSSKERVLQESPSGLGALPASHAVDTFRTTTVRRRAGKTEGAPAWPPPSNATDLLLSESARQLIAEAIEAELKLFRKEFVSLRDAQGRALIVRNGFQPPREVATAIGRIVVRIPKLRRRDGLKVTFRSVFVSRYMRGSDVVDASRRFKYLTALRLRNFPLALEALFNGRIRYVPTSVAEHLRKWWPHHSEQMLQMQNSAGAKVEIALWADAVPGGRAHDGAGP